VLIRSEWKMIRSGPKEEEREIIRRIRGGGRRKDRPRPTTPRVRATLLPRAANGRCKGALERGAWTSRASRLAVGCRLGPRVLASAQAISEPACLRGGTSSRAANGRCKEAPEQGAWTSRASRLAVGCRPEQAHIQASIGCCKPASPYPGQHWPLQACNTQGLFVWAVAGWLCRESCCAGKAAV
jgi:hypothetical protein